MGDRKVGREGEDFHLTDEQIESFHNKGYATLNNFLTIEEVNELELIFDKFIAGEIEVPGKDFCDMSQPFNVPYDKWQLINAMLPRIYFPQWKDNIYERLTRKVAEKLFKGVEMDLDYDQLLCKKPQKEGAVFSWHQDLAYWPQHTPDFHTVTFSLAINNASVQNGCLRVVPGSNKEEKLREHKPASGSREEGHALTVDLFPSDEIVYLPVSTGDVETTVTIHDERIVHGSGGNLSDQPRKTYVIAFRSKQTITFERSIGFSHSHNDTQNWDTFISLSLQSQS